MSPLQSAALKTCILTFAGAMVFASVPLGGGQERVQDLTPWQLRENIDSRKFTGKRIDLVFAKAGLQAIIAELEKAGGILLKIDPAIDDPVTYRMLDVPWDEALATVLSDNGLSLTMNLDESGFKIGRGRRVVLAFSKVGRAKIVIFLYKYLIPISAGIVIAVALPFVIRAIRKRRALRTREGKRAPLPPEDIAEVKDKLSRAMRKERIYRDADLTLSSLAESLGLTPHQLSWIINDEMGSSFSSLVNGYRVEEVKRFLAESSSNGPSILKAAMEAGFNSKATFNRAFKLHAGMTPSDYKKRLPH